MEWEWVILLVEDILQQLIGTSSHYFLGFIYPRWLFGISSTTSTIRRWCCWSGRLQIRAQGLKRAKKKKAPNSCYSQINRPLIMNTGLGGGFKHFLFLPLPGEMIQFDEHIFQVGWNHQPVNAGSLAWGLYYDCQVLFVQCGLIFCQSHISDSFASGFFPLKKTWSRNIKKRLGEFFFLISCFCVDLWFSSRRNPVVFFKNPCKTPWIFMNWKNMDWIGASNDFTGEAKILWIDWTMF